MRADMRLVLVRLRLLTERGLRAVHRSAGRIQHGHLAEAKAVLNSPRAAMNGAQAAFTRKEEEPHHEAHVGSHCGTTDTSERDELLAKIKDAQKP